MSSIDAAIVGLVKGHENFEDYIPLIRRNRLVQKHFNDKYGYDLILFHEGNILPDHRSKIRCETPEVEFVDVSDIAFTLPAGVNEQWWKGSQWSAGYRHMCRFYSVQIWEYVSEYDYIMRLDDDSYIESPIDYDVFSFMEEHDLNHGFVHTKIDLHEETKLTLPEFTQKYVQQNEVEIVCPMAEINYKNYYNNFSVMNVDFWQRDPVQDYLRAVDRSLGIYKHRWGDSTIIALALKLFAQPNELYKFVDFKYTHGSHHWSNYDKDLLHRAHHSLDLPRGLSTAEALYWRYLRNYFVKFRDRIVDS